MTAKRQAGSPTLTRDAIVATALRLLDRHGAEALTIRRVAKECGVQGPSLYWHVQNKDELVDLVVDRALGEVEVGEPDAPPVEQVAVLARGFREVLRAHRGLASLIAQRLTLGRNALEKAEAGVRAAVAAGLNGIEAMAAYYSVRNYVLGFALLEQANPLWSVQPGVKDLDNARTREVLQLTGAAAELPLDRYPTLVALAPDLLSLTPDALFEFGLALLLDGLPSPTKREPSTRRTPARAGLRRKGTT